MAEEQEKKRPIKRRKLTDEELEHAWKFAQDTFWRDINIFWQRVAALLLANSFLVVGFATLYGCCREESAQPLLIAIAAAGIALQAVWPIFAITTYANIHRLPPLMKDIESEHHPELADTCCNDIKERVRMARTCYDKEVGEFYKSRKTLWIFRRFGGLPGGALAIIIFFLAFLALWVVAAFIVYDGVATSGDILAMVLGSLVFLFAFMCLWTWIRKMCVGAWRKIKNAFI